MLVVVGGAAEVGILADGGVGADGDSVDAVDVDVIGDGGVGPHGEPSWEPDASAGVGPGLPVDIGAEESEEGDAPEVGRARGPAVEGGLDEPPEGASGPVAEGVGAGLAREADAWDLRVGRVGLGAVRVLIGHCGGPGVRWWESDDEGSGVGRYRIAFGAGRTCAKDVELPVGWAFGGWSVVRRVKGRRVCRCPNRGSSF